MYQYIRAGFLKGIPARNLTDAEAERYGKKKLLDSGLYIEVRERKKNFKETSVKSDLESEEVHHARN